MSSPVEMEILPAPGPWPGDAYRLAWPVGGEIHGELRLEAPSETRARGVRVELRWETDGRGSTNKGVGAEITVHQGNVPGGRALTLPFELRVPVDGPISYEGHYIHINWQLRAVVDVPWGFDRTTELGVLILPDYDRTG